MRVQGIEAWFTVCSIPCVPKKIDFLDEDEDIAVSATVQAWESWATLEERACSAAVHPSPASIEAMSMVRETTFLLGILPSTCNTSSRRLVLAYASISVISVMEMNTGDMEEGVASS